MAPPYARLATWLGGPARENSLTLGVPRWTNAPSDLRAPADRCARSWTAHYPRRGARKLRLARGCGYGSWSRQRLCARRIRLQLGGEMELKPAGPLPVCFANGSSVPGELLSLISRPNANRMQRVLLMLGGPGKRKLR